jgi:hypothetical protein
MGCSNLSLDCYAMHSSARHDLSHPKWIPRRVQGRLRVNGHKDPNANQVRRSKFRDCHLRLRHRMDAT